MVWVLRSKDSGPPRYEFSSGEFTIKMHHGGQFGGIISKTYIGGSVSSFDYCHCDELSMIELSHMGKELGYGLAKYYHKVQGEFVLLASDKDIMDLGLGFDAKKRVVQIFMKHFEEPKVLPAGTQPSESPTPVVVNEVSDNEDSDDYDPESSSSEDDSDAEFNNSDYNLSDDDNLFEANVDKNAEFIVLSNKPEIDKSYKETLDKLANIDGDSDSGSSELSSRCTSSDEEGGSTKREKKKYKVFNEKTDMDNPQFLVGMEFKTHALFRDAVKQHGIKCGKVIKFLKNDKSKVRAVCRGGKRKVCPWLIYASYVPADKVFRVKTYVGTHTCSRSYHVLGVSTNWIVKMYTERIRSNPTWPVKSLAVTIEKEWTCKVSLPRVFRAKKKALDLIEGTTNEQFGLLYAYAEEVMSSNPGTRVIIKTKSVDGAENQVKCKRLYICWGPLKKGLLDGCRPVIGVDGCHLKGPHGGILLTAVGIDANNCIYPFAYAVVEKEKKKTWLWFLQLVGEDIDIVNSHAWTFMSDKQKGLIDAVSELFPNASHRFCVRHLYNNFKGNFKGLVLKDILWKAARATNVPAFRTAMDEMKKADPNAYKWLCERPPLNWSRSHFSTYPKCDILLNNLCESFNSAILIARDQSIITMLERIRHILTDMVLKRREAMEQCKGEICPKIYKLVEKLKGQVGEYLTTFTGNNKFEVSGSTRQYKVDLEHKICGCRRWDLNGIPCVHAVAAYSLIDKDPFEHVHQCYSKETYLKTYTNMLAPLNGKELWTTATTQQMLPPDVCRRGGRPKKVRRREPEEQPIDNPDPTRLGRKGSKMRCSKCGVLGHNKRRCRKEPTVEESAQPMVEEIDPAVEQSAHGTSGQVKERVPATKPYIPSKLNVRRNMKKATQGMVEERPTQSQPQSQVDLC